MHENYYSFLNILEFLRHTMKSMTKDAAQDVAIAGLQYIAGDTEQLSRFVSLTGMSPDEMRQAATTPSFLEAILDFFMGDEPTLLAFAESANIDPQSIPNAKFALSPNSQMDL